MEVEAYPERATRRSISVMLLSLPLEAS